MSARNGETRESGWCGVRHEAEPRVGARELCGEAPSDTAIGRHVAEEGDQPQSRQEDDRVEPHEGGVARCDACGDERWPAEAEWGEVTRVRALAFADAEGAREEQERCEDAKACEGFGEESAGVGEGERRDAPRDGGDPRGFVLVREPLREEKQHGGGEGRDDGIEQRDAQARGHVACAGFGVCGAPVLGGP